MKIKIAINNQSRVFIYGEVKINVEFESNSNQAQKSISELEQQLQKLQSSFKSAEIGLREFKKLGDEIIKTKFQMGNASKAASLSGERLMSFATSASAVGASLTLMIDSGMDKARVPERISIPHWCN